MKTMTGSHRFRMIIPAFPAFNIYSRIAKVTTALGPLCVATVVSREPDWDVEVIDENNFRKLGPRNKQGLPDHATLQAIRRADVVGLYGGLSSTIPRLHELARQYRQHGVIIIAGGQHFTGENIDAALANGIDFVVIGEGEYTIRELLTVIRQGGDPATVAGLAFMRNGEVFRTPERAPIIDFESLPLPDFDLLRYARIKLYPVGWIRGCGMNCEFCTVKGTPRATSPERLMEQIATLIESRNARQFFIVDDLFGHNRIDTMRLCDMLADYQNAVGIRLNITVQIRLDRGRDTSLLSAMRRAGINTVCIGFESPIAEELAAMDKRTVPDDMLAMTKLYHQAGFLVHGMFIFGYPLPKGIVMSMPMKERLRRFRRFIRKSGMDTIQVLLPVPLPGTALTSRLDADHRIFPRSVIGWEYYDGNFPLFEPDAPMTPSDMQMAIRKIMGRFYRFRNMFAIARNVLIFPAMLFSLWNIRFGWRKWHRVWRNDLLRFGGWIILHRWRVHYRRSAFSSKLAHAEQFMHLHPVHPGRESDGL
jgi:radical SAM superfamily enzyme YgiQ (UPF0313 family)